MIRLVLFFTLLICSLYSQAQLEEIKASSDSVVASLIRGDFEAYVEKIYPLVVEMAGGKEVFIKLTKASADAWQAAGFTTIYMNFKNVLPTVKAGDEIHTIVTYECEYLIGKNTFGGNLYLLAISKDKGRVWSFLNLESYDSVAIKDFITNYNDELPFPVIEGPVLKEK